MASSVSWKSDGQFWPAHTPFFRRFFVNERDRELAETRTLYARVRSAWPRDDVALIIAVEMIDSFDDAFGQSLSEHIRVAFHTWIRDMVAVDAVLRPLPEFSTVLSFLIIRDNHPKIG